MRRREFFGLIGGAAAWPAAARAQSQAARRIGVISAISESDPEEKPRRKGLSSSVGLQAATFVSIFGRTIEVTSHSPRRCSHSPRRWSRWNRK